MLDDNTPFVPPLLSLDNAARPSPVLTPGHQKAPSWVQQPQIPPYYPPTPYSTSPIIPGSPSIHGAPASQLPSDPQGSNYTSASYNTAPIAPRSLSVHGTPAPRSRSEPPGSGHTVLPLLPVSPEAPQATLGGSLAAPATQVSEDPPGIPASPPITLYTTPMAIPPLSGEQSHINHPYYPSAPYNIHGAPWYPPMWPPMILPMNPPMPAVRALPLPPGVPRSAHVGSQLQHQAQWPRANEITRNPEDTAQVDRIDPFAEGPHYGPVLEPFLAKTVGAAIELNPLLVIPPNVHDGRFQWNMLFHWHTSNYDQTTKWNTPATHPRLSRIQIISHAFPWMIHVSALKPKLGVTCGEVLDAISTYMHSHVKKEEFKHLPAVKQRQIWKSYRFNRSTDSNVPGGRLGWGLKRLDWLGKASRFGGLVANEAFVKERYVDALSCTFELKCLPSQPLTAEEILEQERRPRIPSRRRSRSWPASHLGSFVGTDKGKQPMEGGLHLWGTTESGDAGADSSYHGHSRTHTVTPSVPDTSTAASPSAPSMTERLTVMPVPTSDSPIRFDDTSEFSGFVNNSPHRVMYKNKLYPTALHLLEALKFTLQPALQERIRTCKDLDDMYVLSASFQGHIRPDWGQVFSKVVEDVLYLKFTQHPALQALLLWTGFVDIIYSDEDSYWGDGPLGQGANELGKALVRLRGRLQREGDN